MCGVVYEFEFELVVEIGSGVELLVGFVGEWYFVVVVDSWVE